MKNRKKVISPLERFIEQYIPVDELYKEGFFKSKDPKHIQERICQFFGLKSIYQYADMKPFGPGVTIETPVNADINTFSAN